MGNTQHNRQIAFIDSSLEAQQELVSGLLEGIEVIRLEPDQDGIAQITAVLGQYIDKAIAVHIVSHGAPGCVYLGNAQLNLDTFSHYAQQLQQWFSPVGSVSSNLFIYGCQVAVGDAGAEFLAKLRALTGANIAASANLTGNAALGGDWELEVTLGESNFTSAFSSEMMVAYPSVFLTGQYSNYSDLSKAIPAEYTISSVTQAILTGLFNSVSPLKVDFLPNAVKATYQGSVSVNTLLRNVGVSIVPNISLFTESITNPSLSVNFSTSTATYSLSGTIGGKSLTFDLKRPDNKITEIKVTYNGDVYADKIVAGLPLIEDLAKEITLPLTSPSFNITKLDTQTPAYEASGKLNFGINDGKDNFLDFIKDDLQINNLLLKIAEDPSAKKTSITGSLGTSIELINTGDFQAILTDANLGLALEKDGPSISIGAGLTLIGYDPFTENEPDLNLSGDIKLATKTLTGTFKLKTDTPWKNPFSLPDTEFRNLAIVLGGTYITPYVNTVGFVGDLQFGNFDLKAAFLTNSQDPTKNALELTANKEVRLLDLWIGPVGSYVLKQGAKETTILNDALNFLNTIVDVSVVSVDGPDLDTELDPLIKFVPVDTKIGDTTLKQGIGINGQLNAWGETATLNINANPYASIPTLTGSLSISEIDLGFLQLSGANDKTLDLAFKVDGKEQYLQGDGKLVILGQEIAKTEFRVTKDELNIRDLDLNLVVFGLDIDNLNINLKTYSASGVAKLKIFGEEIANAGFKFSKDALEVSGGLGFNILGYSVGVGIKITQELRQNLGLKIELNAKAGSLFDQTLTLEIGQLSKITSLYDWVEDLVADAMLATVNKAIEYATQAFNTVTSTVINAFSDVGKFIGDTFKSVTNFLGLTSNDDNETLDDGDNFYDAKDGNDYIRGKGGNDWLVGGSERDTLEGGAGDDRLEGNTGSDNLSGDAGNDLLEGGHDLDQLWGGDGDDWLKGGNENFAGIIADFASIINPGGLADTLKGGQGNDRLEGEDGDDLLYGEQGNDLLYGGQGNDLLEGNEDTDLLAGGDGNDSLFGGDGTDRLYGEAGNDQLKGDNNDDELHGWLGNDTLDGGNGNDVIYGQQGNDLLDGGDGKDYLYGEGNNTGTGDSSDDTLNGGNGDDYLFGGSGNDSLDGGNDNDFLDGGDGNDSLDGKTGDDYLDGGAGNDKLYGESGNDNLTGGLGDDELHGWVGADTLNGGDGNDTLYGQQDNDRLDGGAGNDSLDGGDGNDSLYGRQDNDTLSGDVGNDSLDGGDGNDSLYGRQDNDTLNGGHGNDTLNGGDGNDTADYSYSTRGITANLTTGVVTFTNLHFNVSNTFNADVIVNQNNGVTDTTQDGIDIGNNNLITQSFAATTAGGIGLPDNGLFAANNFHPEIQLQYRNTDNGNNVRLIKTTTGSFDFQVQQNTYSEIHIAALSTSGNMDFRLKFTYSDGTTAFSRVAMVPDWFDEITKTTSRYYLLDGMDWANSTRTIQTAKDPALFGWRFVNPNPLKTVTNISVDKISGTGYLSFFGATGINNETDQLTSIENIIGSSSSDILTGDAGNNQLTGGDGDDKLYGESGNDSLSGGLGDDELHGWLGADTLDGGVGNDTLYGQQDNDRLYGDSGNDSLSGELGDDELHGWLGADILNGGDGNDTLYGQQDNDTLNGGDGNDSLDGGDGNDTLTGGAGSDTLTGGDGNDTADYSYSTRGITANLTTGVGTVTNVHFNVSNTFNADVIVNQNNGVTDTTQDGIDIGNNNLITQSFAATTAGGIGLPDNGLFAANNFHPEIQLQYRNTDNGNNVRLIKTTTGSFDFQVQQNTYSEVHIAALSTQGSSDIRLKFTYSDGTTAFSSAATVPDWFDEITETTSRYYLLDGMDRANSTRTIQTAKDPALFGLQFVNPNALKTVTNISVEKTSGTGYLSFFGATGINNDRDQLTSIENIIGSSSSDILTGDPGNNQLDGGDGNDVLNGGDGNDIVNGANNDDTLDGGAGNDKLYGDSGNDSLSGGLGDDEFHGWLGADILNGGDGNDTLYGQQDNDSLNGGAGNDLLYGEGGGSPIGSSSNDTLVGGSGNDTLYGGIGTDYLYGESGDDQVFGGSGNDMLDGGSGNDTLDGGDGDDDIAGWDDNDSLIGGLGNDTLNGMRGNDTLYGGTGTDILYGGIGADSFHFNTQNEGIDTIKDFNRLEGDKILISRVTFGTGVTLEQFKFNDITKSLFFNNQQIAILENVTTSNFAVNQDITLI